VPNAISTLLIGLFGVLVPAETGGKLFLSLYVLLYLIGAWRLLRESPLAAVPLPFVLSYSLFHGNVSYAFGVAVFLLALPELRRRRIGWLVLWSVLLFLSHGAALLVYWLVAACHWMFDRSWRLPAGLLPGALLFAAYVVPQIGTTGAVESPPLDYVLKGKVASVAGYFAPFHGFYPFLDLDRELLAAGAATNVVVTAGLVLLIAVLWLRGRRDGTVRIAVALCAVLYLLAPVGIGELVTPGERLLYPALFLALRLAPPSARLAAGATAATAAVLLLQSAFYHAHGANVAAEMARIHGELERVGLGERPHLIREDTFDHESYYAARREKPFYLPVHEVLFRLPYYQLRPDLTIFETGLFRTDHVDPSPRTRSDLLRRSSLPSAAVILGQQEGSRAIAALYPPAMVRVVDDRRAVVLKPR
jgi:hypothetical protein